MATLEPSETGITRWGDATFIRVTQTHPYLGGRRWWLPCPGTVDGRQCERRVRVLYCYWGRSEWFCRVCGGLSYRSEQYHRNWAYERVWAPLQRAGDLRSRSWKRRLKACAALERRAARA